jgi:hypothetical protein
LDPPGSPSAPRPPPVDVIVENIELDPLLLAAPPAPIVTLYKVSIVNDSGDSADAPPPELSPETDDLYPPAPPPPESDPELMAPPPPPPAITRYSTENVRVLESAIPARTCNIVMIVRLQ